MSVLNELQPQQVFRYFEELCAIPHGSNETKAISDYVADFARSRGLRFRQDGANNVIIRKAAAPGYENAPTVMVQGHMDMVCEKADGCTKNMSTEGLELFVDGDVIGAKGTTLGGDDGIAVAMALAILDSDDIVHGPLECVFTVNEEVGMDGAIALDTSDLKAKYLLNLDSETEKVFTVSCAGSATVESRFAFVREPFSGKACEIKVGGLNGGHSGSEIHIGRANSNILMGRVLNALSNSVDMRLVTVRGGNKDNAIPRETAAVVVLNDVKTAEAVVAQLDKAIKNEYHTQDSGAFVSISPAETELAPMDKQSTDKIVCFMVASPDGVQKMSADVKGLVQTSLNMGRLYTEEGCVVFRQMLRSCVDSQKQEVQDKVVALCRALGGTFGVSGEYSAWQYRPESVLREVMADCFRRVYGEEPTVAALHAGLECGIFSGKMPELDCISYGPDITDIHTPRERLHIASTERVWKLTLEALKQLAMMK